MKKIVFPFALLISLTIHAQWMELNPFGGDERFAATSFTVNGKAFVIGGIIETSTGYTGFDELWLYDDAADSWSHESNYPAGSIYGGVAFVIDSLVYIGLGADEGGLESNRLYSYNSITGEWIKRADFPGNTRLFAFSFNSSGKGYIGTGFTYTSPTNYLSDFWEYDPATNKWAQKNDYPGNGRVGLSAMSIDDNGYTGLGDDGSFYFTEFLSYNSQNDTWKQVKAFPGDNRSFHQTISVNGKGYVIGGEKNHGVYSNQMWGYDPVADEWKMAFDFTGQSRAYGNFFYLNGSFYFGMGLIGPNDTQGSNDFWKYEFATGIANNEHQQPISIFPNPASGKIHLTLKQELPKTAIKLYNIHGQTIKISQEYLIGGIVVDFEAPAGVYFLEVNLEASREIFRIVNN